MPVGDGAHARSRRRSRTSLRQRAHRAGELRRLGNDVVGVAAMNFVDRHHHRFDRVDEREAMVCSALTMLAADDDRVDRAVRHRRMAALAVDGDGEFGRSPP